MSGTLKSRLWTFALGVFWPAIAWAAVTGIIEMVQNPAAAPAWYLIVALLIGSGARALLTK